MAISSMQENGEGNEGDDSQLLPLPHPLHGSIYTDIPGSKGRKNWVVSSLALVVAALFGRNNQFPLRALSDPN
jgi:hypothetical protein